MLRDHFHPDVGDWASLHAMWASNITADLNRTLPEDYRARQSVQFGIEIDVGVHRLRSSSRVDRVREAVAVSEMALPEPAQVIPIAVLPDLIEIRVYYDAGNGEPVAAIELVSAANKDRPETRSAFVSKCASLLHRGIGLVIVDVVTKRKASLHNELLSRVGPPEFVALESPIYTAAYHPVQIEGETMLEMWQQPLTIGLSLPTMPLFLKDGPFVPLALNDTYERTCEGLRIH